MAMKYYAQLGAFAELALFLVVLYYYFIQEQNAVYWSLMAIASLLWLVVTALTFIKLIPYFHEIWYYLCSIISFKREEEKKPL